MVPGSTLMYGSSFCIRTLSPRFSSSMPIEALVKPLPSELTTPPVTKMCFVMVLTFLVPNGACCDSPSESNNFLFYRPRDATRSPAQQLVFDDLWQGDFCRTTEKNLVIRAEFPQEGTWWRLCGRYRRPGDLVRFWHPGGDRRWGRNRTGATYPKGVAVNGWVLRAVWSRDPSPGWTLHWKAKNQGLFNREENQFSERTDDSAPLPRTHRESAQCGGRLPWAR